MARQLHRTICYVMTTRQTALVMKVAKDSHIRDAEAVVISDADLNDMGDAILATPAISDGRIYIRTRSQIICVAE